MTFVLGGKSRLELSGVHPNLVAVVERAIQVTPQDFTVFDGLRSPGEQSAMVASGASTTMNSKHLRQADGFSHAVDLVPWIAGKPRWDWAPIYHIAAATQAAASELGVKLRWGGVWDRAFLDLTPGPEGLRREVEAYVRRRKKLRPGKAVFLDGPHYELLS